MSSLKCEYISSCKEQRTKKSGQRTNISFLKAAHWYGLNFLYLFIKPENLNLKISKNLGALAFLSEKVQHNPRVPFGVMLLIQMVQYY